MNRAFVPVVIDVFAEHLYFISNKRGLRRLMEASVNIHWRISKRSGQLVQTIKGCLMQLQNLGPARNLKGRPYSFYVRANDVERQCKLSEAVFRFPAGNLVRVA